MSPCKGTGKHSRATYRCGVVELSSVTVVHGLAGFGSGNAKYI